MNAQSIHSGNQRGKHIGKVVSTHQQSEGSSAFHACLQVASRKRLPCSEYHTLTAGIRNIKQTSFSELVKFRSSRPFQNSFQMFALQRINSQEVIKSVTLFRICKFLHLTQSLLVFHTIHLKPFSP